MREWRAPACACVCVCVRATPRHSYARLVGCLYHPMLRSLASTRTHTHTRALSTRVDIYEGWETQNHPIG